MECLLNILFHNYYEELNKNNCPFEQRNAVIGDDLLRPFQVLKEHAAKQGMTVGTKSVVSLEQADAIVFVDLPDMSRPHVQEMINSGKPLYLIVFESPLIRPVNKDDGTLDCFRKIFTYNDSMVDGDRFIKINYSFDIPQHVDADLSHKEKLCVMIAGNKRLTHPLELYSERIKAVRWFEKNHPDDFDLYGVGWDQYHFGNKLPLRLLNRINPLRRALATHYSSYRGKIERKKPVLERYNFAICYENARDVPGYITEKIFDCFFARCVPVYWGADNVSHYIPASCFIDRRAFDSLEELYHYMIDMSPACYQEYQNAIAAFVAGPQAERFSCNVFSKTILSTIVRDAKRGWTTPS